MKIGVRKNQTRTGVEYVGYVKAETWTQSTGIRRLTRNDALIDAMSLKNDYEVRA